MIQETKKPYFAVQRGCVNGNDLAKGAIIFDEILVDTHDKFDITTGIFTVPVSGTYVFHLNGETYTDIGRTILYVNVNGTRKKRMQVDIPEGYVMMGDHWHERLQKGDEINLYVDGGEFFIKCTNRFSFSGYLVETKV